MDLPSMVQRSGNTLIVRSVVSGNQLYVEQQAQATNTALSTNTNECNNNNNTNSNNNNNTSQIEETPKTATNSANQTQEDTNMQQLQPLSNGNNKNNHNNNELIYGNNNNTNMNSNSNNNAGNSAPTAATNVAAERYRIAALAQQQLLAHSNSQDTNATKTESNSQQSEQQRLQHTAQESKDEGLPQCKIKRNYSCSYCPYFTQNPRSHLMHLRDVHGEKIVINKCKLCLYASRHFQKLVRHMKMVHGCTDGIPGGNGQARGKRGMSRDVRRRRLEESVGIISAGNASHNNNAGIASNMLSSLEQMPTLEQLKRELQLQEQKLQRELYIEQQQQQQQQKHNQSSGTADAYIIAAFERQLLQQSQHLRQSPASNNNSEHFQHPPAAHQHNQHIAPPSTTPSPSGSGSASPPTIDALYINNNNNNNNQTTANANSSNGQEQAQNRLLKCSVCEYTTLFADNLIEHERLEHCKTKFFRCEKCSYVTHIKARFSKHVKYHSMPMIKCVTCDFRTPYKWNLDRHMKNHGGAGPFKCAACDFTADIKQSLTVHEMNHHVPPVGHAAGMSLTRRRNKVGGTDVPDEFLSDSAELLDDQFNNNMDEYEEALLSASDAYGKRKYEQDDEPTDLSQKGNGSASDTSSVHNQPIGASTPKRTNATANLMQLPKLDASALNLSRDLASRSALSDIASMFFNEKQLNELWTLGKQQQEQNQANQAAQLSPTATVHSSTSSTHNPRSVLHKQKTQEASSSGSLFEKLKSSALTNGGLNGNLICPCGHMAKCLSESILHRKACTFATIGDDDELDEADDEPDDADDGRLEIDCADDEDKQSHSALNLSVSGSTRCQHCRHRCKSSADLLQHLKHCAEAMGSNESYDSMSGESNAMGSAIDWPNEQHHPMENRVFIWNKLSKGSESNQSGGPMSSAQHLSGSTSSLLMNGNNEEYSYCGVETAPGYGEVTKKLTPEEEATSSSLKKVFKCPHCSFWASTASRFHVHIVGHLNKKPFECSLCAYRSNWRWDITKHIRLKTIRDPSHKNARVLMNDETGRRNYTKYNKYITLMKVTEEDGDPKLMKSGEMTPNQVASLAFINDLNKNSSNSGLGGSSNNGGNNATQSMQQLSGMNSITLEPLLPMSANKLNALDAVANQFNENDLIRLPLFATIMNAALAEQQQQQKLQDQQSTMITPSVTISAVKRSSPPLAKPSDDLITEIRQEGNEKKTTYRCRKCSFRHNNRDAVLAHVKIHYQDPNYPIVTATLTSSAKPNQQQQQQQLSATPFMNKVLAAMCLSQQNVNSTQQQRQQQHSIPFTAELLQQAMQNSNSNTFNSLALALAGKLPQQNNNKVSTTNAATAILEHGEQNASQSEASAQLMTSPTATNQTHSLNGETSNTTLPLLTTNATTSLQDLLTSPRGTYTNRSTVAGKTPAAAATLGDGSNANNSNTNNMVMVGLSANSNSSNASSNANRNNAQATSATQTTAAASNGNNDRHCRLKHAGDIRIETIDRAATNEQHTAIYRALGNGASNETNYSNNALPKACQALNSTNVLNFNKADATIKPTDLQAAAAYLQAVYKAATTNANPEDIILQQQLQQNDQIEITRLPSAANANLAQLLEQSTNNSNQNATQHQNTKSKQQKCPLCPYISESKSQMNYHISLHKPTQYQCQLCTFVCAKKQHLSNHMRNQHQQHVSASNASGIAALTNGLNLDIGMAFQLAAAAQAQQNVAPLAIDLTALKQTLQQLPNNIQPILQQEQTEENVRTILYCHKCPARFVQQPTNDIGKAKADLDAHLLAHNYNNTELPFQCDFCDFRAVHETQIQAHYYVHTQHYQHKFNELYRHCIEHEAYRAPKLIQMTLARTMGRGVPDSVWIVDQELAPHKDSPAQQEHNQHAMPVNTSAFDSGNSLLKKQLEAGPAAVTTRTPSPVASKPNETDDTDVVPTLPNTSAAQSNEQTAAALEKCLYCPFETTQVELYKAHLKHHICISKKKECYTCDHCDYTDADKQAIEQHTRVHFNAMERLKDVSFFTSYDKLELSIQAPSEQDVEAPPALASEVTVQQTDGEPSATDATNMELVIKREHSETPPPAHNNNNEDDAVNENTRQQEQLLVAAEASTNDDQQDNEHKHKRKASDSGSNKEVPVKRTCNKIILYNNDGLLSVKKNLTICDDDNEQPELEQHEHATTEHESEPEEHDDNTNVDGNSNNNAKGNISERLRSGSSNLPNPAEQRAKQTQPIIVNARTGQVINK